MSRIIDVPENGLEKLYGKEKLPVWRISRILKCSKATVYKRLHKYGIKLTHADDWRVDLPKGELEDMYVKKRLSTWKIEKICGHSRSVVYSKLVKYGIKPRNLAKSHVIYSRKLFSGNPKERAYLVGFVLGDMRVRKSSKNGETIKADCGSTVPEQIKLIEDLFKDYGRVWSSKPDERGRVQVEAFLDLSFSFLLDARKEFKCILKDGELFAPLLAGFTDAEGCFYIGGGQAHYSLGNYDNEILSIIRQELIARNIRCAKMTEDDKLRVTKEGYVRKQNYFNLTLNRKADLLRLFDLIGNHLKHENKIKDMGKAKENIRIRNEKFGVRP